MFRRGESRRQIARECLRQLRHALRHFSAIGHASGNQRFVDRDRRFGLYNRDRTDAAFSASGARACEHKMRQGGRSRIAAHRGREANAGLRSAVGEWHCARLRLRPDRAWLRPGLQGDRGRQFRAGRSDDAGRVLRLHLHRHSRPQLLDRLCRRGGRRWRCSACWPSGWWCARSSAIRNSPSSWRRSGSAISCARSPASSGAPTISRSRRRSARACCGSARWCWPMTSSR